MPSEWTRTDLLLKWFKLSSEEQDNLLQNITETDITVEDIIATDVEELWNQIMDADKGQVWDLLGIDCSKCDQNPEFFCNERCSGYYGCYDGCKEEHIICDYYGDSKSLYWCSDEKISDLIICFILGGWKAVLDYYVEDGAKINLNAMQVIKNFLETHYKCDDETQIYAIGNVNKDVEELVSNIEKLLDDFHNKTNRKNYLEYDDDKITITLFEPSK